jgi:hypothetical protein
VVDGHCLGGIEDFSEGGLCQVFLGVCESLDDLRGW